jgi:hypothetical protein
MDAGVEAACGNLIKGIGRLRCRSPSVQFQFFVNLVIGVSFRLSKGWHEMGRGKKLKRAREREAIGVGVGVDIGVVSLYPILIEFLITDGQVTLSTPMKARKAGEIR